MKKNKPSLKKYKFIFVLIALVLLIAGGVYFALNSLNNSSEAGDLEEVNVRLKWLHQSQFAGHYVADKKGYYEKNGIKVNLMSFDYENFPIDNVLSGEAQFGVAGAEDLLISRSKGEKIRALAVIYQNSPVVAYALSSSGIKEPSDMVGKKIGVNVDTEITVKAMLERQGIDYDKEMETIIIGFDVAPLLNGEVDVAAGYETNEPIQVESAGHAVNIVAPYKYGIKMYGDVLFTTEEMIEKQPELVEAFVQATLRGWEYALDNPKEAVNLTLMYDDVNNEVLNYDHQWKLLDKSQTLIKPAGGAVIGEMSYSNWKRTYNLLYNSGLITEDMDVSEAFTKEFLE